MPDAGARYRVGRPDSPYVVETGTRGDAFALLRNGIRQEDIDEWVIGTGLTIAEALEQAVQVSPLVRSLCLGELPLCMWGCYPSEAEDMRQVWFIASRVAPCHAIAVHRHFRAAIFEMQPPGFRLRAYSYWRNVTHHRWLVAHGFIPEASYLSPLGVMYHSFVRPSPP